MATTAKKQTEKPVATFIDATWDAWKNSMHMVYSTQKEAENLTLRAMEQQQDLWKSFQTNMNKVQTEQKAWADEVNDQVKENLANTSGDEAKRVYEQWNGRFEEVANRFGQLTYTPYREMFTLFTRSQEQMHDAMKKSVSQQQKNREDLQPLFDDFTEQMKKTQNGFYDVSEKNHQLFANYYKA
ncbi:hypothetical protein ACE1TF_00645 [Geomicrobium sp. JSM 1781026]|uniref:hypothetical protein n=1 Tax=Geomicrobium sp. JSM 1781026 TaxID=3344580 RepID=UPI0035C0E9FE